MASSFNKAERYVKVGDEYKLLSYATSSESVEMSDGQDLQTKMDVVDQTVSENHDEVIEVIGEIDTQMTTKFQEVDLELNVLNDRVDEAINVSKGANKALVYNTYEDMISVFNTMQSQDEYNVGQNIYIKSVDVPDLWVYSVEESAVEYTYVDDETFIEEMTNNIAIQVGYYKLSQLETQKVDLRDIVIPLLLDDWVLDETDGTYSQVITIASLSGSNNPIIMLNSANDEATEDELYSYSCISDVVIEQGSMTFIASELPTISFTVLAKSIMAATDDNNAIAAVTALVEKVNEIENDVDSLELSKIDFNRIEVITGILPSDTNANVSWLAYPNGFNMDNCVIIGFMYLYLYNDIQWWRSDTIHCRAELRDGSITLYSDGDTSVRNKQCKVVLYKYM